MGRKSLAAERRMDILNAFEQCILERGIEGTSFQHIAQVLGMDRKMISHYFGNREALIDAMTQRIDNRFNSRMNETLANLEQSASIIELLETFYEQNEANEQTEILWAEITAYATRSEAVRDRLRQSYDRMLWSIGEALKREYPDVPKKHFQAAIYTIAILIERSSMFEWLGVKGASVKSVKTAIEKVLESLK